MKLGSFSAEIISVWYPHVRTTGINKNKYLAFVTIKELKRGRNIVKIYHNAHLEMNKNDYDNKILEIGDRIFIEDGAIWDSTPKKISNYGSVAIKNAPKGTLKIDPNGNIFRQDIEFVYFIYCKENVWSLKSKFYEVYYCTIINSGVKLPIENPSDFSYGKKLTFFLEKEEFNKLVKFSGSSNFIYCYKRGNVYDEKIMNIFLAYNKRNETYLLILKNIY